MNLLTVQLEIERILPKIEKLFTDDCKLTLIIRKPDNDNADFVMSKDDLNEVKKLIERRIKPNGEK